MRRIVNLDPPSKEDAIDSLHRLRLRLVEEFEEHVRLGLNDKAEALRNCLKAIDCACNCLVRYGDKCQSDD